MECVERLHAQEMLQCCAAADPPGWHLRIAVLRGPRYTKSWVQQKSCATWQQTLTEGECLIASRSLRFRSLRMHALPDMQYVALYAHAEMSACADQVWCRLSETVSNLQADVRWHLNVCSPPLLYIIGRGSRGWCSMATGWQRALST